MPEVEFVDPASVPRHVRHIYSQIQIMAVGHLREAHTNHKALLVRLAQTERAEAMRSVYQRAAKYLQLAVRISGREPRPYQKTTNQEGHEAATLYVVIVGGRSLGQPAPSPVNERLATPTAAVPHPGRLASAPSAKPGPLDGFRYEEPRKRGTHPKFSIPTPQPGYQALSRGVEVDR